MIREYDWELEQRDRCNSLSSRESLKLKEGYNLSVWWYEREK